MHRRNVAGFEQNVCMGDEYAVSVSAGSLRSETGTPFPHRWTDEGVTVDATFTGAHLLHLAVAGCVLNDLYREAVELGITLDGVRVSASGGFDDGWASTGITYSIEVDSAADPALLADLVTRVDSVAEIPKTLRAAAAVSRG